MNDVEISRCLPQLRDGDPQATSPAPSPTASGPSATDLLPLLRHRSVKGTDHSQLDPGNKAASLTFVAPPRGMIDRFLIRRNVSSHGRELAGHIIAQLVENCMAVLPISLLLVLSMAVFFQRGTSNAGLQAMGLASAIVGLVAFAEGLRVLIMPLGEMVGMRMPQTQSLPAVLAVAGVLGVLVTYSEPAIAAIAPLADLVDKQTAPYLHFALNQKQPLLVFSIGLGVGIASIAGTLMFLQRWSLKPLIAIFLTPTVALACYMHWGMEDLRPMIGLAWDAGGVTTGPVTVPLLLALSIGVAKSEREKRAAQGQLPTVAGDAGVLEGFGIVTLASIVPVLCVEIFAVYLSRAYTQEDIFAAADAERSSGLASQSPFKEIIYGFRAILPLVFGLLFVVKVIIREPLPQFSVYLAHLKTEDMPDSTRMRPPTQKLELPTFRGAAVAAADGEGNSMNGVDGIESGVNFSIGGGNGSRVNGTGGSSGHGFDASSPVMSARRAKAEASGTAMLMGSGEKDSAEEEGQRGHGGARHCRHQSFCKQDADLESPAPGALGGGEGSQSFCQRHQGMIAGYVMVQCGMILFNVGLKYGFSMLAGQAGRLLPAAYLRVPYEEKSPFYTYAGGLSIVLLVVFSLGFLATRAEPALNVLGRTVEDMSKGAFTRKKLVYSVCVGVGAGLALGACKILFEAPLIWMILGGYCIASLLAYHISEDWAAVAWDSAGVTTGPVTVPFVLSLGIGFAAAVDSAEGFGMLSCASVAPIVAVQFAKIFIFGDGSKLPPAAAAASVTAEDAFGGTRSGPFGDGVVRTAL